MTIRIFSVCLFLFAGCAETDADYLAIELPKGLNEVSGLTSDGTSLYAIGDERGQVYRIQFDEGRIRKWSSFGDPPEKNDFEGLALHDDHLYAVTSNGVIYASSGSLQEDATEYHKYKTGLGKQCEIEGLTAWPERAVLLLLCKTPRKKALKGRITLFAWSPRRGERVPSLDLAFSFDAQIRDVHPSGIAIGPDGRILIVAAREKLMLTLSPDEGEFEVRSLPNPSLHPQAEGLVTTAAFTYIADERGGSNKRGRIARYPTGLLSR